LFALADSNENTEIELLGKLNQNKNGNYGRIGQRCLGCENILTLKVTRLPGEVPQPLF
jgi:hypothetical protein